MFDSFLEQVLSQQRVHEANWELTVAVCASAIAASALAFAATVSISNLFVMTNTVALAVALANACPYDLGSTYRRGL